MTGKSGKNGVIVLSGGSSPEREVSTWSGRAVSKALAGEGFAVTVLDPADPGFSGAISARRAKGEPVFLALHGPGGEDGTIQGFLETLGLPYTGSGVAASALASDKLASKALFASAGLPVPRLRGPGDLPVVVKPVTGGSTIGISIVREPGALPGAIEEAAGAGDGRWFLEEFIEGVELTVGILGSGDDARALPPIEIEPAGGFYDFEAKYRPGGSRHIMPPRIGTGPCARAAAIALRAHRALGCRDLSRSEMIIDRQGRIHLLELNTIPGFTGTSLYPEAAAAAGIPFGKLARVLVEMARDRAPGREAP